MESHSPVSETERKTRVVILQAATPSTDKGPGGGRGRWAEKAGGAAVPLHDAPPRATQTSRSRGRAPPQSRQPEPLQLPSDGQAPGQL